jgi:hypothetical protein
MQFSVPDVNCPACGATMPRKRNPLTCLACSKQFQISQTYRRIVAWGLMGLLFTFFYLLGLRGWQLFVAAIVLWFPILGLSIPLLYRIIPPRLEPYQPAGTVR